MKNMYRIKGSLSLLFVSAILIICAGFFIVSCGNDPQKKTFETNKGAFAIDFSLCPSTTCTVTADGSEVSPVPSIGGREITVEVWVKSRNSTVSGGIFSRMDGATPGSQFPPGAVLFVNNNQPKFAIRRLPVAGDVEASARTPLSECVKVAATSTECIVPAITGAASSATGVAATFTIPGDPTTTLSVSQSITVNSAVKVNSFTDNDGNIIALGSGTANSVTVPIQTVGPLSARNTFDVTVNTINTNPLTLVQDAWTHIAGAVTTEKQKNGGPNGCATVGDEQPHLAIYINGELNNCATTGGEYAVNPNGKQLLIGGLQNSIDSPAVTSANNLNAVVDEVRGWLTGRTETQIGACKDTEIGIGGVCGRTSDLAAYYRLNEGEGDLATDISGNGLSGSLFYNPPPDTPWENENKWVSGAPITGAD
jgi:hypothetical protein